MDGSRSRCGLAISALGAITLAVASQATSLHARLSGLAGRELGSLSAHQA